MMGVGMKARTSSREINPRSAEAAGVLRSCRPKERAIALDLVHRRLIVGWDELAA